MLEIGCKKKKFYMKKILLPFDGNHFSEETFEFVRVLNEKEKI